MRLHTDLLEQATFLVGRERGKPRQASLRRAVSAAYYALFHLLIYEATGSIVGGRPQTPLRHRVGRAFDHSNMARTCRDFQSGYGGLPSVVKPLLTTVPPDLRTVAVAFINLQEARHDADYDVGRRFTRSETQGLVDQATIAFQAWERVRTTPEAATFLISLLLVKQWNR